MDPFLILGLLPVLWLLLVLVNLLLCPRSVASSGKKGLSKLSILIPARNEAASIGPCVAALISQAYPEFELLVLDDHSTDGTGTIARAAAGGSERFRLLRGRPLPEGWLGQTWACHQLAEAARGEFLLFLGATTLAQPGMLARLVATAHLRRADLLSGLGQGSAGSVGEALLLAQPLMQLLLTLPLWLVPRGNHPALVAATGACLLVRRESYRRVGGHAAIRQAPVDHLALARLIKRSRGRVLFCNLVAAYECRHHRSPGKAWRSVVRRIAHGRLSQGLLFTVLLWLLFLLPPGALAFGLLTGMGKGELLALMAGSMAGGLMGILIYRILRLPVWLGLLMPLQALLFALVVSAAAWRAWARRPWAWKGRRYA